MRTALQQSGEQKLSGKTGARWSIIRGVGEVRVGMIVGLVTVAMSPSWGQDRGSNGLDITAQPLASALEAFSEYFNLQVGYKSTLAEGVTSNTIHDANEPKAALNSLLSGTGLQYRFVNDTTVVIEPVRTSSSLSNPDQGRQVRGVTQEDGSAAQSSTVDRNASIRAQDGEPIDGGARRPSIAPIEEIVVTSRRREESVQSVPLSVVVLDAAGLELRGVNELGDLHVAVPNAQFRAGASRGENESSFTVRGVPGVAMYVDGIWQASSVHILSQGIIDVDRVEVLRGPQGTLFGRQTTGGAFQIITRPPAEEFRGRVALTTGSHNQRDFNATVDVPLTETLLTKWTAASLNRDGFVKSVVLDADFGDVDNVVTRGDILWSPTDNLRARFIVENNEFDQTGVPRIHRRAFPEPTLSTPPLSLLGTYAVAGYDVSDELLSAGWPGGVLGEYETQATSAGHFTNDVDHYSVDMTWDVTDRLAVRWLGGHREQAGHLLVDNDLTPYVIRETYRSDWLEQDTHELQFLGSHGRFNWVFGLYYWDEIRKTGNISRRQADFTDEDRAAIRAVQPTYRFRGSDSSLSADGSEGQAVFTDVTVGLTERIELSLGLRYNDEEITEYEYEPHVPPPPNDEPIQPPRGDPWAGEVLEQVGTDFTSTTPRISLRYRWNPDLMAYVSYAEGFGVGGFNVLTPPEFPQITVVPYDAETVRNYEAGLRSDWANGRLRLNATVFNMVWDDIQLGARIRDPISGSFVTGTFLTNAGEAQIDGVELEISYVPTDALRFHFNAGWLEAKYTDPGTSEDITTGSPLQHAPELSFDVGVRHELTFPNGGALASRISYGWIDEQRLVQDDLRRVEQDAYGLLSAALEYRPPAPGNWVVALSGTNLTDEWYMTGALNSGVTGSDKASLGRPRQVSARLTFFFD